MKKPILSLTTKEDYRKIEVENPITHKKSIVTMPSNGTTEQMLASIMLAPDATKDQKDLVISNYLSERRMDNASFLAELFRSKGTLVKETQAFKRQIRWDFEMFADKVVGLFEDMANDITSRLIKNESMEILKVLSFRLMKGAELIKKQREDITEARMREKGFGIYLDKQGQAYSIYDKDIEEVVKKEREEIINDNKNI